MCGQTLLFIVIANCAVLKTEEQMAAFQNIQNVQCDRSINTALPTFLIELLHLTFTECDGAEEDPLGAPWVARRNQRVWHVVIEHMHLRVWAAQYLGCIQLTDLVAATYSQSDCASDSMFYPLTMCALQIVLWLWLLWSTTLTDTPALQRDKRSHFHSQSALVH